MNCLKSGAQSIFQNINVITRTTGIIFTNWCRKRFFIHNALGGNIFLWSAFILLSFKAYTQKLVIVYEHQQINYPEEILRFAPQMADEKNISRYSLCMNNGRSLYTRDSIYLADEKPRNSRSFISYRRIYKDYNSDIWVENSSRLKARYCLKKKLNDLKNDYNYFNWHITAEKKIIAGIECVKATSINGTFVWFAPDIPYPDGPDHGIFNLPGLVMWYETSYHQWKAVYTFFDERDLQLPECTLEENEEKIKLTELESKDLSAEECIRLNKDTPLKQWIRLKN
jgi:GLPGLI family protein